MKASDSVARDVAYAGGAEAVAAGMGLGVEAIKRWCAADRVPPAKRAAFERLTDQLGQRRSET